MIKTFEEQKKTARIMRNVFIVVAVVYVGLIIWSICRQNYVSALFDAALLVMVIGFVYFYNSSIYKAELVLEYIKYVKLRNEFIEVLINEHTWFSVDDRLPREDPDNKGNSVGVIGLLPDGRINKCYYSFENSRWFIPRYIGTVKPTHWMYIPEVNP